MVGKVSGTKACVVAATLALAPAVVLAAEEAQPGGDASIVASLDTPKDHLSCEDAAAQTQVFFQFANPPFVIQEVTLYLDGKGVADDAIDSHWPTITLKSGLHPGRNTVDVVATGENGRTLNRRLVVLVGSAVAEDEVPPARVSCDQTVASTGDIEDDDADQNEPEPVIVENEPRRFDRQPEIVEDGPVYVYRPYPVVAFDPFVPIVPVFGFGFFYSHYHPYYRPPVVVYRPYYPRYRHYPSPDPRGYWGPRHGGAPRPGHDHHDYPRDPRGSGGPGNYDGGHHGGHGGGDRGGSGGPPHGSPGGPGPTGGHSAPPPVSAPPGGHGGDHVNPNPKGGSGGPRPSRP